MKKLYAVAALALMLCLTGLVMSGTAFAQQCVDNEDGTVTDNSTGLMWQKATAGQMTWDTAMSYASRLSLGGHSGWRLPGQIELSNLFFSPCKSLMEVVSSYYWSSRTDAKYKYHAWRVPFGGGDALGVQIDGDPDGADEKGVHTLHTL